MYKCCVPLSEKKVSPYKSALDGNMYRDLSGKICLRLPQHSSECCSPEIEKNAEGTFSLENSAELAAGMPAWAFVKFGGCVK